MVGLAKKRGDFSDRAGEVFFKVMQQVVFKEHSKTFTLKFICIYLNNDDNVDHVVQFTT